MSVPILQAYELLLDHYGPQYWWPGESRLEIIVGAVLTQNTSWKNVELALANLREANQLEFRSLLELHNDELQELIRPAGYYRLKARRLKNLLEFIDAEFGSIDEMMQLELTELRERLLSVNGIGPETADSIVLYAGELPTFVVDAYTGRVAKRHGWIEFEADYYAIKSLFEDNLPIETQLCNEYHALIVKVGKDFCKKKPDCDRCPLAELLPEHGPLEN